MKIAIVGKMRSGKDTLAKFFIEKEGLIQLAFADGIKAIGNVYFPEIMMMGKPRFLYQHIGQEFRKIDPYVWIKDVDKHMKIMKSMGIEEFVISDVRQLNEYTYLKEQGFTVIMVKADDDVRRQRIIDSGDVFSPSDFYHETEMAVDRIPYDYVLYNNGTYEEFKQKMESLYTLLKGKENGK